LVRMRRCSSASLDSGTAKKRDSVACSAAASRKPKMDGDEPEYAAAFLPDVVNELESKMVEERSAAEKSFMGSGVKVSKVAQAAAAVVAGASGVAIFAYYSLLAPTTLT